MTAERLIEDDSRIRQALDELRGLVLSGFPDATFWVERAVDDPAIIHLVAEVDVEDTDEVADLVIDRVVDLQVDDGLPIHVIPVRTPARVAAMLEAQAGDKRPPTSVG